MTKSKIAVTNHTIDPYIVGGSVAVKSNKYWRWGDDNMFPNALAAMSRRATTHRRIINDKADYIAGKGIAYDVQIPLLGSFVGRVNSQGETLRQVIAKLAFDKTLFGNAFLEVVCDEARSTLSLFHHDASKCRVAADSKAVILHHDWRVFKSEESVAVSLYPEFGSAEDGTLRAMIHYKDYEPMFEHYGVPAYIAGLNVSAIAYKTDRWNMSRLDNSFQMSGIMLLDNAVDSEQEAEEVIRTAQSKFGGKPGQVLFVIKEGSDNDNSKFIPISSENDGDWSELHDQAMSDIVVAHSWFRALSGLDYDTGFSAERILYEYEVALNTIILGEQEELLEPIKRVIATTLGVDCSSLEIINRPPTTTKPSYMKVWEARKADGFEYDAEDEKQQLFISEI
ncbi:MAG: phage portal protein [Rikenellaceae bacterium]